MSEPDLNAVLHLHRKGRFTEAETGYRRILAAEPANASALHLLGVLVHQLGRSSEGADLIRQAIGIEPRIPAFYSNLGEALRSADRVDEAIDAILRGLRLKPDLYEAIHNLGGAFGQANRVNDAIACYQQAITMRPDDPEPHWNLAIAQLLLGEFKNGWREFEWRLQRPQTRGRTYLKPRWTGVTLPGKTLLLWCEQGFGDVIQFARYLPLVKRHAGARIILDVHRELVDFLASQNLADQVVAAGATPPAFDAHAPLMSVPFILGTTLENVPRETPYLFPSPARIQEWAIRLPKDSTRKIGLAWAGRPTHQNDRRRSISPEMFERLGAMKDVTFVTVQPRAANALQPPKGLPLLDLGPTLRDFADTAALLSQLDLLITVDTAVAHLAGALARPVWTLLPFAPDWRWMLEREDSPWYPTMRLFRQPRLGDWQDVIERVRTSLQQL